MPIRKSTSPRKRQRKGKSHASTRRTARKKHFRRDVMERMEDEEGTEIVTDDVELWLSDPEKYDIEGLDDSLPDGFTIRKKDGSTGFDEPFLLLLRDADNPEEARALRGELNRMNDMIEDFYEDLNSHYTEDEIEEAHDRIDELIGEGEDDRREFIERVGSEFAEKILAENADNTSFGDAGYIILMQPAFRKDGKKELVVHHVWTNPVFRGENLSTYMMRELLNFSDTTGTDLVLNAQPFTRYRYYGRQQDIANGKLATKENVEKLVDFYRSYGFETEGDLVNKRGTGVYVQAMERESQANN